MYEPAQPGSPLRQDRYGAGSGLDDAWQHARVRGALDALDADQLAGEDSLLRARANHLGGGAVHARFRRGICRHLGEANVAFRDHLAGLQIAGRDDP